MKITVIGCGRWGSFIAWYLDSIGKEVTLYGRESSTRFASLKNTRMCSGTPFTDRIRFESSLDRAVSFADMLVISVNSQGLRELMSSLTRCGIEGKTTVLCMKGLEIGTGKRLSEVVREFTDAPTAVWVGPGHVQEFQSGIPGCMVIDSESPCLTRRVADEFSGGIIRFYYGADLIGSELGAAAKNVIGIAAGMLDGLSLGSLKGPLMARGTREIARLIEACGGSPMSAYGLCHLGDYEATLFSQYSHNRRFGESFVKGESYTQLAEGFYTAKAIIELASRRNVELPICSAVYEALYCGADVKEKLYGLFLRPQRCEF